MWKTIWKQEEIKYFITFDQYLILRKFLRLFGKPAENAPFYELQTTYIGEWKNNELKGKIRVRTYPTGDCFIEEKIRRGDITYKHRLPIKQQDNFLTIAPYPESITKHNVAISYRREPWEIEGARITIDYCVKHGDHVLFDDYILECKGDDTRTVRAVIESLLDIKPQDISKFRAALAYINEERRDTDNGS